MHTVSLSHSPATSSAALCGLACGELRHGVRVVRLIAQDWRRASVHGQSRSSQPSRRGALRPSMRFASPNRNPPVPRNRVKNSTPKFHTICDVQFDRLFVTRNLRKMVCEFEATFRHSIIGVFGCVFVNNVLRILLRLKRCEFSSHKMEAEKNPDFGVPKSGFELAVDCKLSVQRPWHRWQCGQEAT